MSTSIVTTTALVAAPPPTDVTNEQTPGFVAAVALARRGLRVFPVHIVRADGKCSCDDPTCSKPGKHPLIPAWQNRATATDTGLIAVWFKYTFRGANIGIATGSGSGIFVLDVDPRHGGDDTLDRLVYRHGLVPDTLTCMSGGGGTHYYFKHPCWPIANRISILPGLDIKADGGLVIAPPSQHESGRAYAWDGMLDGDTPIAEAPVWLLDLIRSSAAGGTGQSTGVGHAMIGVIDEGERNNTLASIGGYLRHFGAAKETIEAALLAVNLAQCQPPLAAHEVRKIAKSIAKYKPAESGLDRMPADFTDIHIAIEALPESLRETVHAFQANFEEIWCRRKPMGAPGWYPYALSIAHLFVEMGMSHTQIAAIVAEHWRQKGSDHAPLSVADHIRLLAIVVKSQAVEQVSIAEAIETRTDSTEADTESVHTPDPADAGNQQQPSEPLESQPEPQDRQPKTTPPVKPVSKPKVSSDDKSGCAGTFVKSDRGKILPILANAELMLRQNWFGMLAYNEFALCVTTLEEPPGTVTGQRWPGSKVGEAWTDNDDRLAAIWLQRHGVLVGDEIAGKAVLTVALDKRIHPVRAYLESLKWDGTVRLDTWLTDCIGVTLTPYAAAVGARWLIAAVARIFEPGCKADCCLILEGDQGARKSTALRTVAGQWFTDEVAELGSKDAALQTRGVWIIELSELDAMGGTEVARIKAFMSRSVDRFRPPYGRQLIESPRQCVFAGTVNHSSYLKDETGGRRFWPARCGEIKIDKLIQVRDQLWAEALVRYRAGKVWWLESLELTKLATQEQGDRYEGDAWDEIIAAWVERPFPHPDDIAFNIPVKSTPEAVCIPEVLYHAIGKRPEHWTQTDKNRVARTLRSLGYERYRLREDGRLEWRYRKKKE